MEYRETVNVEASAVQRTSTKKPEPKAQEESTTPAKERNSTKSVEMSMLPAFGRASSQISPEQIENSQRDLVTKLEDVPEQQQQPEPEGNVEIQLPFPIVSKEEQEKQNLLKDLGYQEGSSYSAEFVQNL